MGIARQWLQLHQFGDSLGWYLFNSSMIFETSDGYFFENVHGKLLQLGFRQLTDVFLQIKYKLHCELVKLWLYDSQIYKFCWNESLHTIRSSYNLAMNNMLNNHYLFWWKETHSTKAVKLKVNLCLYLWCFANWLFSCWYWATSRLILKASASKDLL